MNVSLDYKYTYRQDHNAAESGYNGSRTVLQEYTQWGQTNVNLKDYKDYKTSGRIMEDVEYQQCE